jgi:hypothetical protein
MTKENSEKRHARPMDWLPEDSRTHFRNAHEDLHNSIRALFPPKFLEYRRAARQKALLGVRSLIDHAIEKLETGEKA